MPNVSVVIPIYQTESYLVRCVESVLHQTHRDLEIILVDDGSTDGSAALCDALAARDARIFVLHQENKGLGMARNVGMAHAAGEYLLFVDSDDYIHEKTVECCLAEAEIHRADVVLFGRFRVLADGTVVKKAVKSEKLCFDGERARADILPGLFTYERGLGVSACGMMYRRSLLEQCGLQFASEREILSEDAYFMISLFAHVSKGVLLPACFYYYCENRVSLTQTFSFEKTERNDRFLRESLDLAEKLGYPAHVGDHIRARYHGYAISILKQAMRSSLSFREKRDLIHMTLENSLLRSTLTADVLKKETVFARIFWRCIRRRWGAFAHLLLWCRAYQRGVPR